VRRIGSFEVVERQPELGSGVAGVTTSNGPSIQIGLGDALNYLPRALDEPFVAHPLARLLVKDIPLALDPAVAAPGYKIQGSPGRGRWAETVWVAIFDRLITTTAQRGYYLVYLFRADGSAVYLSLNQGTTAVHAEVGGRRYLNVLRDRSTMYAELLGSEGLAGLQLGPIELGREGRLTRGYEAGSIAAVSYVAGVVPGELRLRSDLALFLELYRRLIEMNDNLAEDNLPDGQETPDGLLGKEGASAVQEALEAKQLRWHRRAERNHSLSRDAKRIHGTTCVVCGFNYAERYGALGDGYIEAHHLTPFADLPERPTRLDPERDFAVVCANCHRMIHKRRPPYELHEVRLALR
jgi:5-methylcytosine-specific restriction enzyme A